MRGFTMGCSRTGRGPSLLNLPDDDNRALVHRQLLPGGEYPAPPPALERASGLGFGQQEEKDRHHRLRVLSAVHQGGKAVADVRESERMPAAAVRDE